MYFLILRVVDAGFTVDAFGVDGLCVTEIVLVDFVSVMVCFVVDSAGGFVLGFVVNEAVECDSV